MYIYIYREREREREQERDQREREVSAGCLLVSACLTRVRLATGCALRAGIEPPASWSEE